MHRLRHSSECHYARCSIAPETDKIELLEVMAVEAGWHCNELTWPGGATENAGLENSGPLKMQEWKTRDHKWGGATRGWNTREKRETSTPVAMERQ